MADRLIWDNWPPTSEVEGWPGWRWLHVEQRWDGGAADGRGAWSTTATVYDQADPGRRTLDVVSAGRYDPEGMLGAVQDAIRAAEA